MDDPTIVEGAPAGTPPPSETPPQGAPAVVQNSDGLKVPEGLAQALVKAGKDPTTITTQEMLDFANHGVKIAMDQTNALRNEVKRLNAEVSQVRMLDLNNILASGEVTPEKLAKVKEIIEGVTSKAAQADRITEIMSMAVEQGLVDPTVLDAAASGDPKHAATVFTLLKQIKESGGTPPKPITVGGGMTPPGASGDGASAREVVASRATQPDPTAVKMAEFYKTQAAPKKTPA